MRSLRYALPLALAAGGLAAFSHATGFRLESRASFAAAAVEECGAGGEATSVRYRMHDGARPLVLEETTRLRGCPGVPATSETRVVARDFEDLDREVFAFTAPGEDARVQEGARAWDMLVLTQHGCCALNDIHTYHRLTDGARMGESHVPAVVIEVGDATGLLTFVGQDVRRRPAELVADTTLSGILTFTSDGGQVARWALDAGGDYLGRADSLVVVAVGADGQRRSLGQYIGSDGRLAEIYGRVQVELHVMEEVVTIPLEDRGGLHVDRATLPRGVRLRRM